MRPVQWEPPIELSAAEQGIVKRIRRAKLFIFLREPGREVFDPAFQEELASLDRDRSRGHPRWLRPS
jgi:transposase